MRRILKSLTGRCVGLFVLVFLSSCASTPAPTVSSSEAQRFAEIDKITLLPVVLLANLKEGDRKAITDMIESELPLELALKGYVLSKTEVFSSSASYSIADVAAMNENVLNLVEN